MAQDDLNVSKQNAKLTALLPPEPKYGEYSRFEIELEVGLQTTPTSSPVYQGSYRRLVRTNAR